MKRRGFIFTLDAIFALILVMVFVSSVVGMVSNLNVNSSFLKEQSKYSAQDVLNMLRTSPLRDIVPPKVIENWSSGSDPVLLPSLVNDYMSPLDIIATYWAVDPLYPSLDLKHKAEIILGYILNVTLSDYNYELLINNYTSPYLRKVDSNYSKAFDVSPATLELSGYKYNQTPRGYVARAYIVNIGSKENVYTIQGGYIVARTDDSNEAVVIRYIVPEGAVPSDAQIEDIEWFLEPAWVDSEYEVYLNGNLIWSGHVKTNYRLYDDDPNGGWDLIENFVPGGKNVFEVRVYKSGYDGGEDGAQYIRIKYRTSVPLTLEYPRRFYFEDVSANYNVTLWKYLFVPGYLSSLNIQVTVANVSQDDPITLSFLFNESIEVPPTSCTHNSTTNITVCVWEDNEIANALSTKNFTYTHLSSRYTTIVLKVGDGSKYYDPRIHVLGEQSYIDATYLTPILLTPYSVDITVSITNYTASTCGAPEDIPDSDSWCRDVTWSFNVPNAVIPLWVKFQFPWLYIINYGQPYQEILVDNELINSTSLYKHPPNPFIIALARVGYTRDTFDYQYARVSNAIANGTNNVTISLGEGYWLQPENGIGEFTYIIRGFAGYGDVFQYLLRSGCGGYNITYFWQGDSDPHYVTAGDSPYCDVTMNDLLSNRSKYAVDDAILRLFNNLGGSGTAEDPILIQLPDNVNIVFASMGNIPRLFEPITVTLRVWREG